MKIIKNIIIKLKEFLQNKNLIYLIIIFVVVSLFGLFVSSPLYPYFQGLSSKDITNDVLILIGLFLSIATLVSLMSRYLSPKTGNSNDESISKIENEKDLQKFTDLLINFEEKAKQIALDFELRLQKILSASEEQDMVVKYNFSSLYHQEIAKAIKTGLTQDFFDKIGLSIKQSLVETKGDQLIVLRKQVENSIGRLKREIELLTKRANLNLIIGSTVTLVALMFLGYFVVTEQFSSLDVLKVTLHFLPRLSLVLFIEFFSFFFLKLYKANLSEIKYYQNELTNIENKYAALMAAFDYGNEADISAVIKTMSETERNFKLQKGESTVELEKVKFENKYLKDLFKNLGHLTIKKD